MRKVRADFATPPCDRLRIPCPVQGSIQRQARIHHDEGVNVRCWGGFAAHPRPVENYRRQGVASYFAGARGKRCRVCVAGDAEVGRGELPHAVSVEGEPALAPGTVQRGV